jgi:hypothetical protein
MYKLLLRLVLIIIFRISNIYSFWITQRSLVGISMLNSLLPDFQIRYKETNPVIITQGITKFSGSGTRSL